MKREVLPGVVRAVPEVRVEAVFDDGSRLAVVRRPVPGWRPRAQAPEPAQRLAGDVELEVTNTAAVPISVTSHFHFFEANPRLRFDRAAAYGMRLAVRRARRCGSTPGDDPARWRWSRSAATGWSSGSPAWSTARWTSPAPGSAALGSGPRLRLPGRADERSTGRYADVYGPTTGDRIALGRHRPGRRVEARRAAAGDECCTGFGKTARDGMHLARGRRTRPATS